MSAKTQKQLIENTSLPAAVVYAVIRRFGGFEQFKGTAAGAVKNGIDRHPNFSGHVYTIPFAGRYRDLILQTARNKALDVGVGNEFDLIAGLESLKPLKLSATDIAAAIYQSRNPNRPAVFNAMALFAGEEVCRAWCDLNEQSSTPENTQEQDENTQEQDENARTQAAAQLASIVAMVAALNVDYDRLEELETAIEDKQAEIDELQERSTERPAGWTKKHEKNMRFYLVADTGQDRTKDELKIIDLQAELAELKTEYYELKEQANGNASEDAAQEAIQQDALSVEIRTGWYSPGQEPEPEEFNILLCTGGPAVRIRGELDQHKQPSRAWLEYQDWFAPWEEYFAEGMDNDALLAYCQQFYFGE